VDFKPLGSGAMTSKLVSCLFISGQSKDSTVTNCIVYGHYNNLRKTAIPNGINDYSTWSLSYNLTKLGFNDIRVELSCPGLASSYDSIIVYVKQPPLLSPPPEEPAPIVSPGEEPAVDAEIVSLGEEPAVDIEEPAVDIEDEDEEEEDEDGGGDDEEGEE
jgi:hypothetical protein